jgi:hypothetical protein
VTDNQQHDSFEQTSHLPNQTYGGDPLKRHSSASRGCLYLVVGVVIIVLFIGGQFFGFWDKVRDSLTPKLPPPAAAVVNLSNTITNAIVSKGMLVTSEMNKSNRDIRVNVVHGLLNANGYGASHFAEGTIFAGIDLESDLVRVTKISDKHYKIMLPAPEITSCSLKPLTQYDRSTSAVANWDATLDLASYMAITEFVSDALTDGILENAEQSGKRVVGDLVRAVVGNDVEIEISFHSVQTPKIDDTCEAHEPLDWVYNPEKFEWSPK